MIFNYISEIKFSNLKLQKWSVDGVNIVTVRLIAVRQSCVPTNRLVPKQTQQNIEETQKDNNNLNSWCSNQFHDFEFNEGFLNRIRFSQ